MKYRRAGDELKGRTYFVDLTAEDGILHADPTIVASVTNSLSTTLGALTSEGASSATDPRFPAGGFPSEPSSYEPVTHLINKVIDTAKPYILQSHLSGLRFHPFGREVKEIYGSHKRLKPDGVGIIGDLPIETKEPAEEPAGAKRPVLSCEQVEVVFESKGTVKDMVRQSATYARCCALSNQRRFFSLGIGFHFRKLEAYFFAFHRAGLSSSRPLKVTTSEGFKGLVNHIVGILSIKDEAAYGLDTTRFEKFFHINYRHFEVVRSLHSRGSLRGRSTNVLSLQGMYMRILNAGLHFIYRIPSRRYGLS
jgi:Fungal protein kinase